MPSRPARWVRRCSDCSRQARTLSSSRQKESESTFCGWVKLRNRSTDKKPSTCSSKGLSVAACSRCCSSPCSVGCPSKMTAIRGRLSVFSQAGFGRRRCVCSNRRACKVRSVETAKAVQGYEAGSATCAAIQWAVVVKNASTKRCNSPRPFFKVQRVRRTVNKTELLLCRTKRRQQRFGVGFGAQLSPPNQRTSSSLTACKSAGFSSPAAWRSFKVVSKVSYLALAKSRLVVNNWVCAFSTSRFTRTPTL